MSSDSGLWCCQQRYIYIYMSLSRGARRGRLLCSVETTPGLAGGDTATSKAKNGSTKGTRC